MPTFEITSPDGKKYRVTAPDGASQDRVLAYAKGQFAKPETYDPTEGMSNYDKVMAGIGKSFVDTGRGVGQFLGVVDRKDVAESRKRDAPLMDTGAGQLGNVIGDVATTVPAMFIPGVNTVRGAAMLGGAFGATRPSESTKETLLNTGVGALGGAGGQVAGNVIGKGINAAKAASEPFTRSGQDAILGRLLNKTAGGGQFADDAARNLAAARELVPGSLPTAGQAAGNPGIAALERTATATQPEVAAELAQRMANQNSARAAALGDLADVGKRDLFVGSRDQAAKDLYQQAFAQAPQDSPWIKGQFTQLMKRPDFQDALKEAQTLAANEGLKLDPKNQTQIAHYIKLALDDKISTATGNAQRALIGTKEKLLSVMENDKFSPAYAEARRTFQEMSKPINEIDTVAAIQKSALNPLTGQVQPQAFARSLSDQTAQRATGFGKATLENTLSPEALQTLNSIKADLLRSQFAQNAGRGPGSDTVQKLAYSNLIDAAGIPSWLRGSGGAQLVGNLGSRGADALYGRANKEMAGRLAEAMLTPKEVARLIKLKQVPFSDYQKLSNTLGLLGANSPGLLSYPGQ